MRSEYAAHQSMCDRHPDREDWVTAQYVDDAIDMLACGVSHDTVRAMMFNKMVPVYIQRRVLAGHAVRRHREKGVPA